MLINSPDGAVIIYIPTHKTLIDQETLDLLASFPVTNSSNAELMHDTCCIHVRVESVSRTLVVDGNQELKRG